MRGAGECNRGYDVALTRRLNGLLAVLLLLLGSRPSPAPTSSPTLQVGASASVRQFTLLERNRLKSFLSFLNTKARSEAKSELAGVQQTKKLNSLKNCHARNKKRNSVNIGNYDDVKVITAVPRAAWSSNLVGPKGSRIRGEFLMPFRESARAANTITA